MGHAHYFAIVDLTSFLSHLTAGHYVRMPSGVGDEWVTYSKALSNAVAKQYSYHVHHSPDGPVQIRVTYQLLHDGLLLKRLADHLKELNARYRRALTVWKTKPRATRGIRQKHHQAIQQFLVQHRELISCYRYHGDSADTEGNTSFNLQVAATPKERAICFEFIKALLDAFAPQSLVRARRQMDKPRLQRDGWIKRYADLHKKRGWTSPEIVREIQKELREGTWNERSRLQYNLAMNTIGRIAGLKLVHAVWN